MDKLSELIKEAYPLYKSHKRNVAIMKMTLCCVVPLFVFGVLSSFFTIADDIYVSLNNNNFSQELLLDDFGLAEVE